MQRQGRAGCRGRRGPHEELKGLHAFGQVSLAVDGANLRRRSQRTGKTVGCERARLTRAGGTKEKVGGRKRELSCCREGRTVHLRP